MQKFTIVSFLIIIVVFNACRKEKITAPKSSITGKWYWVEQTYNSYTNNQLTNHEDYTTILDPQSYFEFDSDGKFIENPQDRNGQFKYGTYQLKGDSVIITDEEEITRWVIKTLSQSSLVIQRSAVEAPFSSVVTYSMKR